MIIGIDANEVIHGERAIRRYAIHLIRELSRLPSNLKYRLLYFQFRKPHYPKLENLPTAKITEKTLFLPGKFVKRAWKNLRYPKVSGLIGKIDLYHVPGMMLPPKDKTPTVLTVHGMHHKIIPELLESSYLQWYEEFMRWSVEQADYFITVSETMKRELLKVYSVPENKVRAIPLGVTAQFHVRNKKEAKEYVKRKFGINRPYLLYVGGIQRHKNVSNILRSFQMLKHRLQDNVALILAGDQPPGADQIVRLKTELGLDKDVFFTGYIEQETEDLPMLYGAADAFLFVSFYEGWASPPLEAMASGIPVIAADIPSLRENLGDAAMFVDPNKPDEIASATDELLKNSQMQESYKQKGLFRVRPFTWQQMAEKTEKYYEDILAGKVK